MGKRTPEDARIDALRIAISALSGDHTEAEHLDRSSAEWQVVTYHLGRILAARIGVPKMRALALLEAELDAIEYQRDAMKYD